MKRIALIQEEIAKEQFKELCRFMNTIFQIIIVCPDELIPKIPGVLGKNIICHIKSKRPQVLDEEHRRRSGVALSEHMNLPQSGYEYGKMVDDVIHREILIGKLLLL